MIRDSFTDEARIAGLNLKSPGYCQRLDASSYPPIFPLIASCGGYARPNDQRSCFDNVCSTWDTTMSPCRERRQAASSRSSSTNPTLAGTGVEIKFICAEIPALLIERAEASLQRVRRQTTKVTSYCIGMANQGLRFLAPQVIQLPNWSFLMRQGMTLGMASS